MDCRDIQNYLFAYGEGELSPDQRHAMEEHAGKCESCARLLESYRAMESVIESDRATEPNPFAATRILQYLENHQQPRAHSKAIQVLRPVLITLALFFAIALGFMIGTQGITSTSSETVSDQPLEMLRTELFIDHFVEEDIPAITNQ
jgi:anti-sigma factor RsiW